MKTLFKILSPVAAAACLGLAALPITAGADDYGSGSDLAFNDMLGTMASRDTGSGWFDYYVAVVNQQIAASEGSQPYGAAGPNGPLDGFSGYIGGFRAPDTGSSWFNAYVDAVNVVIGEKQ